MPNFPFLPSASNPTAPSWLESMVAVLAAGAVQPLVQHNLIAPADVKTLVSAFGVVLGALWAYAVAHPSTVSPFAMVAKLIGKAGGQKAWNGDVEALGTALIPVIEQLVDAKIKAKAGLFAGPLDAVANTAIKDGASQAEAAVEVPLTNPQGA